MRYLKGTIALSETRDYPLLRRVLRSTFVTGDQLFEFMRLEYCASSRKAFENRVRRLAAHALLNEIHLVLKRTGMLTRWTPESDIRSRNELSGIGYAKDYDATIEVRIDGHEHRFALEYERTPKAKTRYEAIRMRFEAETEFRYFLYIAPNHDLLEFVRERFQECSQIIHFGLYRDVLADGLDLPVQANRGSTMSRFSEVLGGASRSPQRQTATPHRRAVA